MKLSSIATVRSGLVLSRKLSRVPTEYRYLCLNLRSINPKGYIEIGLLDTYDAIEPLGDEYLTQPGDIIVRLSAPYTAVLIDSTTAGIIISSNFSLIRPDMSTVVPEYLAWLLNTPKVKKQMFESASGNMLGAIKPSFFNNFDLVPLPVEDQKKIAAIYSLSRRETQLLLQLAEEKERYYALLIDSTQRKMRRQIK